MNSGTPSASGLRRSPGLNVEVNMGGSWCFLGGGGRGGAGQWNEEGEDGFGDVAAVVFENWDDEVVVDVTEEAVDAFEARRSCEEFEG